MGSKIRRVAGEYLRRVGDRLVDEPVKKRVPQVIHRQMPEDDSLDDDDKLPDAPFHIMTIKWWEDGDIVIDCRGFGALDAWAILQRAADRACESLEDPEIIFSYDDLER